MGIIIAILIFSAIIIIHELGHFLLAKANHIRVDEFSLGMGPTLFKKQGKETLFSIKLLPFGGSCMMGEDDPDDTGEGSFNSKSVWARISVIAAGPLFNILLALILSIIMVGWVGYTSTEISGVIEGYSAEEEGMEAGDIIRKIGGRTVHIWEDISLYNLTHNVDSVEVVYERDGERYTVTLTPEQKEGDSYALLGVQGGNYVKTGVLGSIQYGAYTVKYWLTYTIDCLRMLVTGMVGLNDLSGPVGIVSTVDSVYQEASAYGLATIVLNMLNIAILITANLGVMNLLPIPALDGGRLVFLIIEAIRGKRVPPEKEGMVHFAGLAVLMVLMVVILFNDILKLL